MICACTGHRPQKLPWGSREEDPHCRALQVLLAEAVAQAADRGCDTFLTGMARGCDTWFAEAVLALRKTRPQLRLEAVIPCAGQQDRWPEADRRRYGRILEQCDRLTVLEPSYSPGCMTRRNCAMIDRADLLITVYDGSGGGTGQAVAYARRRGVTLLPLWL